MPQLPIHGRDGIAGYTEVDVEDWERFKDCRLYFAAGGQYASLWAGGRRQYLHSLILGRPPVDGLECDHENRDKLDNRRSNLRWLTPEQNQRNRGGRFANTTATSTSEAREQILALVAAGLSVRRIAREVGVQPTIVQRVKSAA